MQTVAVALAIVSVAATAKPHDTVDGYVQQTLRATNFERAAADLNGDGRSEIFVYVTDKDYCGTSGCLLLVLSPEADSYRVVMRATAVQLPITVLPTSTRGWRDVAVSVMGGGITEAYTARLRFDGRRYPSNPTVPPATHVRRLGGKVLLSR